MLGHAFLELEKTTIAANYADIHTTISGQTIVECLYTINRIVHLRNTDGDILLEGGFIIRVGVSRSSGSAK